MNEEKKLFFDKEMIKLVVILFLVSLAIALLLGVVNFITKDRIAEAAKVKTAAAMEAVLKADSYNELSYEGRDAIVSGLYEAIRDGSVIGWVAQVKPIGFGGIINMAVGVALDGSVTGVTIISMTETSGLGTNAYQERFRNQYAGKSGSVALSKYGGDIDALTGATITSSAVTDGVNSALDAVAGLIKEG